MSSGIETILVLALLILLAKGLGELMYKIGLPTLIGEILAGVILGPQLLNLLDTGEVFSTFAKVGALLLLFLAGFQQGNIRELMKYKRASLAVGIISSTIPLIAVIFFALSQGYTMVTSLFLGVALSSPAMGVALRMLMSVGELKTKVGKTVTGSLFLNNIIGFLLLTGVVAYGEIATGVGGDLTWRIGKVVISVIAFCTIFYLAFHYLPKFTTWFIRFRVEEANFSLAIVVLLLSGWAANVFGLSAIIGAFFAGMILSRSPIFDNHAFLDKISSLSYGFFIPLFFAVTGARLKLAGFTENLSLALTLLGIVAGIQVIAAFIGTKSLGFSTRDALLTGSGIITYGDVTLIVMSGLVTLAAANPGLLGGDNVQALFSSVLLLLVMTIVLAPVLMRIVTKLVPQRKGG